MQTAEGKRFQLDCLRARVEESQIERSDLHC